MGELLEDKALLSTYKQNHFGKIEPPSKYECERCHRTYKYSWNLKNHIRFECGVEPKFNCPYCDFRSKQKSNLKTHIIFKHMKRGDRGN